MFTDPPGLIAAFQSTLVTCTAEPFCDQLPFQPPSSRCQVLGQLKANVQPLMADVPVLVMSMLPMYPLPQSLVSAKCTAQVLVAGVPVVNVSGADAPETRPVPSRVTTFTVYRVPGSKLCTVREVPLVSPNSSLSAPSCLYTSYLAPDGMRDAAGQEIVAS